MPSTTSCDTLFAASSAGAPDSRSSIQYARNSARSAGARLSRWNERTSVGGDNLWLGRRSANLAPSAGLYFATRTGENWTTTRADLGLIVLQLELGSVGFYGGSARMVVALSPAPGDRLRLVELSTLDGITWSRLDTLALSDGATVVELDPALSADGCFVMFRRGAKLFAAARGVDGNFNLPSAVVAGGGGNLDQTPAVSPDATRVWLIRDGSLLEGVAP